MANVSIDRLHDRPRLPYSVSTEPVKLYTPIRKAKSEYPRQRALTCDVSDTLQHAALINIVAAVNEDIHGYPVTKSDVTVPGSTIDTLKNRVAVISTLMTPRHRSVSIPKQQHKVFSMSQDIVQKKPVYYKHHTGDDIFHKVLDKTSNEVKGKVNTAVNEEISCPSPVQSVRIMPVKTKYNDSDFKLIEANLRKAGDKHNKPVEHSRELRSSAVRRLGTLKSRSRKVHEVSKCDAVDLMDANNSLFDNKQVQQDPAKAILDSSRKMIPQTHMEPYDRPKSLPGAFPAKAKKFSRAKSTPPGKPHVYKNNTPITNSMTRDTPQSMYSRMMSLPGGFGYESLAIGNGVNQEPDVLSPLSHDSAKSSTPRVAFTGLAIQRHTRRLATPKTPATYSGDSAWSEMTIRDHDTSEPPETVNYLHEAIESAMGRSSKAEEDDSENKENETSMYNTSKPTPVVRCNPLDLSSKTPRKVQLNYREISTSSDDSFNYDPSVSNVNGGSSIIQMPMSVFRSYSPAVQPMSARELLRFKHRIFPANMHQHHSCYKSSPYLSASSVMNIKQVYTKPAVVLTKQEQESDESGEDLDKTEESGDQVQNLIANENEENKNEGVFPVRESGRFTEDKCRRENGIYDVAAQSIAGEQDTHDFYKLIKAIDTHSYSGFEHKKLRRVSDLGQSKGEGKQKDHYVKVKLR